MSSSRAETVAEVLYDLKKQDRYATLSAIARRAGFNPGVQLRTILTCMKLIEQDWPHLESWRAIHDDGVVMKNSRQAEALLKRGVELRESGDNWNVILDETLLLVWETSLDGKAIPVKR